MGAAYAPLMLYEIRQYQAQPGKRDELVALMEETIIPYQISCGVAVVGSFTGDDDPNLYVWIRRFDSEEHRASLYDKIYGTEQWTNEILPLLPELMNREANIVTRVNPTAVSPLH